MIDFNKYVIVDTMSFYHDYNLLDLNDLATKINIEYNEDHLELVQNVFFKLYLKSQSK